MIRIEHKRNKIGKQESIEKYHWNQKLVHWKIKNTDEPLWLG